MALSKPELICAVGSVAVLLLWMGVRLGAMLRRLDERRAGRFHNERGQAGERRAEQLLRAQGYRVRARHVAGSYAVQVDGDVENIPLIADFIVERDGQRWVAEVKTGKQAPRVGHADTRRQMLEYQLAFEVPGVLLVDAEANRVHQVRFPLHGSGRASAGAAGRVVWRLASVAALVACAWWALNR